MLTPRQRRTLEALCDRIAPAASGSYRDRLVDVLIERFADLPLFSRRRLLQAVNLVGSPALALLLIRRARGLGELDPAQQDLLLQRCATHPFVILRLTFDVLRQLIVNTWYGLPEARGEVGHPGPLPERQVLVGWEGPLAGSAPVVSGVHRERERDRLVPDGVVEASHLTSDSVISAEFCVIGSGVGGSVAACTLAEGGRDVVVLESGAFRSAADFSTEEVVAMRSLYADAGFRATEDAAMSILQARCVGGGSVVNWMVMLRTPDYVLDEWQRVYGVEDMSPSQMRSTFERFERENNVARVADGAHSRANRILLEGSRALGWRADSANVNARECLRSGLCGMGCPYDAKQSMPKTYLRRALSAGAKLYSGVHVDRVAVYPQHHMLTAQTAAGIRVIVNAAKVIVAAGAVETPALLQRSGIGNENVGKHLRLHPTTGVNGVYDEPVYAGTGIPLTTYCDEFIQLRGDYGHWIETPPLSPGLAAVAIPEFGAAHRERMKQYPFIGPLVVLARDGSPEGPSRGTVRWERSGRARIDYKLSNADRAILMHGMAAAAKIHEVMGAREVFRLMNRVRGGKDPVLFSAHVNGTARMGGNPHLAACDPNGQLYGVRGVYVMDGSLLPSAPGVNPHETIASVVGVLAGKLAGR